VPKLDRDPSDLSLTAFSQYDAQSGLMLGMAQDGHFSRRCSSLVQIDSLSPAIECFLLRMALHINPVFFLVFVARVREQVGQLAVVGEQNQTFAP
jgi:hypothetical protein